MTDITKKTFNYCLRNKQGKGCLCAAMFNITCDEKDQLSVTFKSDEGRYGDHTRNSWLVPFAGDYEMSAFFLSHVATFRFLEDNFPGEDWYSPIVSVNYDNMSVKHKSVSNREPADQMTEEFWDKQFEISKKMFEKGFLNGNYPQGHYYMVDGRLCLAVSYFGKAVDANFTVAEVAALNSCHKLHDKNLKKNYFTKKYVHDKEELIKISSTDFWRLTLASQMYSIDAMDGYIRKFINLLGPSSRDDVNDYVNAVLANDYADFELSKEELVGS